VPAANELAWGYPRPITFHETGGLGVLPRNFRVVTMIAARQGGARPAATVSRMPSVT